MSNVGRGEKEEDNQWNYYYYLRLGEGPSKIKNNSTLKKDWTGLDWRVTDYYYYNYYFTTLNCNNIRWVLCDDVLGGSSFFRVMSKVKNE